MSVTTILALDPGPTETGYVVLQHGRPISSGVLANEQMRQFVVSSSAFVAHLAVEMIASYGMPVGREVFETCVWIGRFQQSWRDPAGVRLVYRKDVKLHLCGTPRAKDSNVWQALVDRFGGEAAVGCKASPGPLYGIRSHARSALAVAVTAADGIRQPEQGSPMAEPTQEEPCTP